MDTRSKKFKGLFKKPLRIGAFVIACISAASFLCSAEYSSAVLRGMDYSENYYESTDYHEKVMDTYEQLCILSACYLANVDDDMNYVGNKNLLSDFLYYLDYNSYKYKKTDSGIIPVSDYFDYYVSYTYKPNADIADDEDISDELVTDEETTADETVSAAEADVSTNAEGKTRFITNIDGFSYDARNDTEQQRLDYLESEFSNYILRANNVVMSDMVSSSRLMHYYHTSPNENGSGYLTGVEESYPSNFVPLGSWYYDSYGRYFYNYGNYEPIKFYEYAANTDKGSIARNGYVTKFVNNGSLEILPDGGEFEYSDDYDDVVYIVEDKVYNYVHQRDIPLEELSDYQAYPGSDEGITVFISPKSHVFEGLEKSYASTVSNYKSARVVVSISAVILFIMLLYLVASSVYAGISGFKHFAAFERVPFEAYCLLAFTALVIYMSGCFYNQILGDIDHSALYNIITGCISSAVSAIGIFSAIQIIEIIFGRRLLKSLITPRTIKFFIQKYKTTRLHAFIIGKRKQRTVGQKLMRRTVFTLSAFMFALFILLLAVTGNIFNDDLFFFVAFIAAVIFIVNEIKNLFAAAALGKLSRRIHALRYNRPFDEKVGEKSDIYADIEKLENIDETVRTSVEEQLRSERLKIELVANVSHDLKTPLTSIISYIDLLKKCELDDEAASYVKILDNKSQKLKSIVADVFSLAKATSGIDVNLEKLDFVMLFNQSLADMDDKLRDCGKIIKITLAEQSAVTMADGAKMYRVFQNIIDNAVKYSLAGSRIFLDIFKKDGKIYFTARNVSSYPIDFTADEIVERFVRGDKSRTDGGSGLGLSIAQSFTEACGGEFKVELDGDMFKAIVAMNIIEETEEQKDIIE